MKSVKLTVARVGVLSGFFSLKSRNPTRSNGFVLPVPPSLGGRSIERCQTVTKAGRYEIVGGTGPRRDGCRFTRAHGSSHRAHRRGQDHPAERNKARGSPRPRTPVAISKTEAAPPQVC